MSRDYDHLFKLLIIGDSGKWVGEVVNFKFLFLFTVIHFCLRFESFFFNSDALFYYKIFENFEFLKCEIIIGILSLGQSN